MKIVFLPYPEEMEVLKLIILHFLTGFIWEVVVVRLPELSPGLHTYGGNGGGIVIIVADGIAGNGGNILADGGNGGNETGVGGSGGGGAGGSIALSLNSYGTNPLTFSALGGNGGDNPGTFGEGGGGGGGLLYLSTNYTGNITLSGGLARQQSFIHCKSWCYLVKKDRDLKQFLTDFCLTQLVLQLQVIRLMQSVPICSLQRS